jgi:hypothetical protein
MCRADTPRGALPVWAESMVEVSPACPSLVGDQRDLLQRADSRSDLRAPTGSSTIHERDLAPMALVTAPMKLFPFLLLVVALGCRSVPGDTVEDKRAHIDAWETETLGMLYEEHPKAREQVEQAPGYLVVSQRVVKIPFIGWGGGYGVLVDRTKDRRMYIKLDRMDVGGGWGARNLRVILVIHEPKLLRRAGKTHWSFGAGAEASAKAGDSGAAGGMGTDGGDKGYTLYELTDEGVSVTWTLYSLRLSEYSSLN